MRTSRWGVPNEQFIEATVSLRARFQEVDALRVVWHGHYLAYFEEARVAFGRRYNFTYEQILAAGYIAPLVHIEVDYFIPIRFDEEITIYSRMHPDSAAKIDFTYLITNQAERKIATGRTVQAFTDTNGELSLTRPAFFVEFINRCAGSLRRE